MATRIPVSVALAGERRFFLILSLAMAFVLVAGFSMQLAMGRSSFGAPPLVHVHALVFFGWTFFFLLQSALAATGSVALHRRLGWIGAGWAAVLVVLGSLITAVVVQQGRAPFFFTPLYFLVMNPLSVIVFALLFALAVRMRRRSDWHRRLMICAMAGLTGPGIGRLLPLPLLIPFAGWAVFAAFMLFPIVGMIRDRRHDGTVHTAWIVGVAVLVVSQSMMSLAASTGLALPIYRWVVAGTPGAHVDPMAYPPFPGSVAPPSLPGAARP